MSWDVTFLRYLIRWLVGCLLLAAGLCGGGAPVAAQANAQPRFSASSPVPLIFTAGTAQTAAALPPAMGGDGTLRYAIATDTPLPSGLTFNAATRAVAADATAVAQAATTYRLVATDADGDTDALDFTIAIGHDYDDDDDGLIAIATLAQLDAMRYDLNGNGGVTAAAYAAAFPLAAADMGCPASGCRGYELTTDLDFDQNGDGRITAADTAYWNGGAGWVPIGHGVNIGFRTAFQGNGHAISHLFIHRSASDFVGLFFRVGKGARVEGLALQDVQVWGRRGVGGLAGRNLATIANSSVSGSVTGSADRVGGLVGDNYGRILTSSASATVVGETGVGGLVGANGWTGDIVACAASGAVTASGHGGGLVGGLDGTVTASYATGAVTVSGDASGGLAGRIVTFKSAVTLSYATGAVVASGNSVGGLVGINDGTLVGSYAMGAVLGRSDRYVGGLVGENEGTLIGSYATGAVTSNGDAIGGLVGANGAQGRIAASYATGAVTASSRAAVGGLAGENQAGTIVASYARGGVAGRDRVGGLVGLTRGGTITASYARGAVSGRTRVGGLVGDALDSPVITASYWDVTASGQATSSGGAGHTTQELQTPTAYAGLYATWNVDMDSHPGADDPWAFGTNSQYPVLGYDCLCPEEEQR